MTNREEQKEKINCIAAKGFADETDKHVIWEIYRELFGQFQGNLNCGDCIRDAVRKIQNELNK